MYGNHWMVGFIIVMSINVIGEFFGLIFKTSIKMKRFASQEISILFLELMKGFFPPSFCSSMFGIQKEMIEVSDQMEINHK